MARPLAAIKCSKRPDRWGTLSNEALGAFEKLKRRLTEAPILSLTRQHGVHTLGTDASEGQAGAVRLHEREDRSWCSHLSPSGPT